MTPTRVRFRSPATGRQLIGYALDNRVVLHDATSFDVEEVAPVVVPPLRQHDDVSTPDGGGRVLRLHFAAVPFADVALADGRQATFWADEISTETDMVTAGPPSPGLAVAAARWRTRAATFEDGHAEHDVRRHAGGELAWAAVAAIAPGRVGRQHFALRGTWVDPWPWDETSDRRPGAAEHEPHPPTRLDHRLDLLADGLMWAIAEYDRLHALRSRNAAALDGITADPAEGEQ